VVNLNKDLDEGIGSRLRKQANFRTSSEGTGSIQINLSQNKNSAYSINDSKPDIKQHREFSKSDLNHPDYTNVLRTEDLQEKQSAQRSTDLKFLKKVGRSRSNFGIDPP